MSYFTKLIGVLPLLVAAPLAIATGGCVDSPENPSIILALLGSAAATLPWVRNRWNSRPRKHRS
jgi:hypothetical protein